MYADRFSTDEDEGGSVKKKLKLVDQNLEHIFNETSLNKSIQLCNEEPLHENRDLIKKYLSIENKELLKKEPSIENRELINKEPSIENKELFKKPSTENIELFKKPLIGNRELFKKPSVKIKELFKKPSIENRELFKKPSIENRELFKKKLSSEDKELIKNKNISENKELFKKEYLSKNIELYKKKHLNENKELFKKRHTIKNRKLLKKGPISENRELFKKPSTENRELFKNSSIENRELVRKPPIENKELFKKPSIENRELLKQKHSSKNSELYKKKPSTENRELFKKPSIENKELVRRPSIDNRELFKKPSIENNELFKKPSTENRELFKKPSIENRELLKKKHSSKNSELYKKKPSSENRELFKKKPSSENRELYKKKPSTENRELFEKPSIENSELFKKKPSSENRELFEKPSIENSELFKKKPSSENSELFKKKPSSENRELFKKKPSSENRELFKKKPSSENNCNSFYQNSQNDNNIKETDNSFDINKQNSNKNQFVKSDESNCNNGSNKKFDNNDGDSYLPISDSEFELEKNINEINYESNCMKNSNEKINEEFTKDKINDEINREIYNSINIDNDEVYELLDKAYQEKQNNQNINTKKTVTKDDFKEYEKTVLEEVCINHFDILPENWIEATHKSGMPIYLHKKTRVVTLSRPYFLGPGDPKSHLAPLSAISCLQYRKGLESKESLKNEPDFQMSKLGNMIIPNAKVETAQENIIKESLTHQELREYCQSLFKFKKVKIPIDKTCDQDTSSENILSQKITKERPSLPDSTKLISFPVQSEDHDKRCTRRREWIMNPNGKSYVSILHEYLQQALKTQPWYEFKELENSETPYSATVVLNDVQYGVGMGNSKKQAKLNAAQATLDILIPEMKNKIDSDQRNHCDPVIFDQIKVTDPRVTEFCAKTTEPSPYAMLLVCLQRNFGECDVHIDYKLNNRRRMLNQCTMTVGKHIASVACKNKRDGKQKASQVILGLLHPHIDNWGSLLRLYGNRSIKNAKEKKQEEQEITQLQSKAAVNQPNFAILNKLKEEMLKIRDQRRLKNSNALPYSLLVTTCPYTTAIPSLQHESEKK